MKLEIVNQSLIIKFETMRTTLIAERQANTGLKACHNKLLLLAREQSKLIVTRSVANWGGLNVKPSNKVGISIKRKILDRHVFLVWGQVLEFLH